MKNINFKNKNINENLALAVIAEDISEITKLIDEGANLNYLYKNKKILDIAFDNKNLEIMKLPIEKGIELSKESMIKIYDLALDDFNFGIIDLIKDKYDLEENIVNKNKYLLFLCYTSNSKEVKRYIKENNINPIEVKDKINRNALIISTLGCNIDTIKMLIEEYKFEVNYTNDSGVNALMAASARNSKESVKYLLEKNADVNIKTTMGYTALMYASEKGHTEIVKTLIEANADINSKDNEGCTALIKASFNKHVDVLKVLIEAGANVNDKEMDGWTALMFASQEGHNEIAKLLTRAKATTRDKDNKGYTALMLASQNGHVETVKTLLEKDFDVNDKQFNGCTSLMLSSEEGNVEISKILIENCANVNEKDNNAFTALMYASGKGHTEIVELLLEKGASINDKNSEGNTSLIFATSLEQVKIVNILLEKRAKVNERNNNYYTALNVSLTKIQEKIENQEKTEDQENITELLIKNHAVIDYRDFSKIFNLLKLGKRKSLVKVILDKDNINMKFLSYIYKKSLKKSKREILMKDILKVMNMNKLFLLDEFTSNYKSLLFISFINFIKLCGLEETNDVLNIKKLIIEAFIEYHKEEREKLLYEEIFKEKYKSIGNKINIFVSNLSNIIGNFKAEFTNEELIKKFNE